MAAHDVACDLTCDEIEDQSLQALTSDVEMITGEKKRKLDASVAEKISIDRLLDASIPRVKVKASSSPVWTILPLG